MSQSLLTQHDQVCNSLLVATGVGSVLADVLALIAHPNVTYLDGRTVQVWGAGREADSALHGGVGVVGLELGVEHGDVHPFSFFGLIDPRDLMGTRHRLGVWLFLEGKSAEVIYRHSDWQH